METPKYLQTLWSYKWLLAFGLIVAIIAAFFAGFTITNGQVESRAVKSYTAGTTVLVDEPDRHRCTRRRSRRSRSSRGSPPPSRSTSSASTQIYAYLVAGARVKDAVEAEVGRLDDDTESITAIRRTTQPAGDERFPGGLKLPVLEVVGTAPTEDRAEEISAHGDRHLPRVRRGRTGGAADRTREPGRARDARRGRRGRGRDEQPGDPDHHHGRSRCSSRSSPWPSSSRASGRAVRSAPSRVDALRDRSTGRERGDRAGRMRPSARRPMTPTTTCSSAQEPGRTEHRHDRCRRRAGGRRRSGRRRDVAPRASDRAQPGPPARAGGA